MKIIHKETKEVYEVIGLPSSATLMDVFICLLGNVKTKELTIVKGSKILKDYELK